MFYVYLHYHIHLNYLIEIYYFRFAVLINRCGDLLLLAVLVLLDSGTPSLPELPTGTHVFDPGF